MKKLFVILLSRARAGAMPLCVRLRLRLSPALLRSRFVTGLRRFFTGLLDVRPRDGQDYLPVFRWMVSRRLVFALTVALGLLSAWYISAALPEDFFSGGSVPAVYRYSALPLKFCSGTVSILAWDGRLAYTGQVDGGAANGEGTLYGADGGILYRGGFSDSMYDGSGTLYYPGGTPRYTGAFRANRYSGSGTAYRPNGTREYSGEHVDGRRTGRGILYNSLGEPVFEGVFQNGRILCAGLVEKTAEEAAALYTGRTEVYQSGGEYCVSMPEIGAVCAMRDGDGSLENRWTVRCVYVLEDCVPLEGAEYETVSALTEALGRPIYSGSARVSLPEAVALNLLAEDRPDAFGTVSMELEAEFEDVFAVSRYDRDFQVYLYAYEGDGLVYTVYCPEAGQPEFLMYAVEAARSSA